MTVDNSNFSDLDNWILQFISSKEKNVCSIDKFDLAKNNINLSIDEMIDKSEILKNDGLYLSDIRKNDFKVVVKKNALTDYYGRWGKIRMVITHKTVPEIIIIKFTRSIILLSKFIFFLIKKLIKVAISPIVFFNKNISKLASIVTVLGIIPFIYFLIEKDFFKWLWRVISNLWR